MDMSYMGDVEKNLYLNVHETRRDYIIDLFENCQSFHLPVLSDGHLIGIICLFDIARILSEEINLLDILQTNCYVAGKEPGIFSFKLKGQSILPFVDENGKFTTFINRVTSKCYIPSQEYLKLVDASLSEDPTSEQITAPFDILLEENQNCIFVTTKPGRTISVNDKAILLHNINSLKELESIDTVEELDVHQKVFQKLPVRVHQNIQTRKELTLYRIDENIGNDIVELRRELADMERLAQTYKAQLSSMHVTSINKDNLIFQSRQSRILYKTVVNIAQFDSTVLLLGESGVGKSKFASIIHQNSFRKLEPFIVIDCASLPANLLESELFGYENGAFTGAKRGGKVGLVELADKGTLFLDEISELPLELQGKLLRLLQEKKFYRVGGENPISVNIRIITATNRNLQDMVNKRKFRQDLYYRLNVIPIEIPPLRKRKEDIIPLADGFLQRLNQKYNLFKTIHPSTYRAFLEYDWPGNIRELENTMEYMVVTSDQNVLYPSSFIYAQNRQSVLASEGTAIPYAENFDLYEAMPLKKATALFEKKYLQAMMKQYNNIKKLSEVLDVDRSTITRKLSKYKCFDFK